MYVDQNRDKFGLTLDIWSYINKLKTRRYQQSYEFKWSSIDFSACDKLHILF